MAKFLDNLSAQVQKPKIQLALGLSVAAAVFIAPKDSSSSQSVEKNNCKYGSTGDCDLSTDGNKYCIATSIPPRDCS